MSERILVVDDDENNRDLLSRRLRRAGYDAVTADGGQAALNLIDAEPFDLVLLDITMPGMDGFEVLRIARETRSTSQLPIVMATARTDSSEIVQALNAGANDYVTKPLDFPVVLARVRTQLARKRAEEEVLRLQQRMQLILDSAGEGIVGVDENGVITFANPAARRMAAQVLVGRDLQELWADGVVETDAVHGRPAEFRRGADATFPVEYASSPIHDGDRRCGAVITFNDVTERRAIEQMKDSFIAVISQLTHGAVRGGETAPATEDMGSGLSRTVTDLQAMIGDFERVTAEKERIVSELRIARDLQMSIVPRTFPSRAEFEVYGQMEPAEEVGGDLYNFFELGGRLAFVVGDVSGKGVPAAIFMAVTNAFLQATAGLDPSPGPCLERLNEIIVRDNDAFMFVTLFYATLDVASGEVAYVNAGHNMPYVLRANGVLEAMPRPEAPAIGIIPGARFPEGHLQLAPGDRLLLYTDGVTEAFDPNRKLFGAGSLEAVLRGCDSRSPEALARAVFHAVHAHATGAPQSDDITVLALGYRMDTG